MSSSQAQRNIRVGVIGAKRGMSFGVGVAPGMGMDLVAICDNWRTGLDRAKESMSEAGVNVTAYTDYDRFLEHDMDAVLLANNFHEHAPFAIKALRADMHVMSETAACFTLGEGVALIEAVEETGKIYMFAENFAYRVYNQEMRRLFQSGVMGEFRYGEAEYVHPDTYEKCAWRSPGKDHWRWWIPATYYCTHAMAPIMRITDTWPVKVNAFVFPHIYDEERRAKSLLRADLGSAIIVRMDNEAVARLLRGGLPGHGNGVRIHCTRGLMENLRWGDSKMLRIRREPFHKEPGEPVEKIYAPDFPEHHEAAVKAGHGGGDFFVCRHFADAIRTGAQPYLDVYRGVAMSIVGIQAYRSALNDSNTVDIPDFRKKEVRAQYADDHWNPDPAQRREGYPWPSIRGDAQPTDEALDFARKIWEERGYEV